MAIFPTILPSDTVESIEKLTKNLEKTSPKLDRAIENLGNTAHNFGNTAKELKDSVQFLKQRIEFIETEVLKQLMLEYNVSRKVLNTLVGAILATRSINEIMYAKTLASQVFFFLSCVNGCLASINSSQSLYSDYMYNQCSTPVTALVANSMAFSFYLAGKQAEYLYLKNVPQPAPVETKTPNFEKILPPRGGNFYNLHQFDYLLGEGEGQFAVPRSTRIYLIKLPDKLLMASSYS